MIALAPGVASNLEVTLPLVVFVCLGLILWDDLARMFERDRRDEFDEETTLEEWLACLPERHLTLLARPNAVGDRPSPTREVTQTKRETRKSAP